MKLYQFSWGHYPRRVLVYLKEKGITDIELVEIDVINGENRTPEYLKKNPTGTIPVLETDDGQCIGQSTSILQYLEEKYPAPNMMGTTAEQAARTRDQLALVNEAYIYAGICTFHSSPLFVERRNQSEEAARALHIEYKNTLKSLEAMAGDGDYLGGKAPNLADVAFFVSEQFMRDLYKLKLPRENARLEAIYQRFLERPSAEPEAYPDFVVENAPLRAF